MEQDITNKSTKEEVADFFKKRFRVPEDISNNFIKEYISGDILSYLTHDDFRYLGLKLAHIKRWYYYYEKNEDKFKDEEIKEEIFFNSSPEEVKKFLHSYLDFKEDFKLDGEMLFGLNEEDLIKLGMKLVQRKRLIKYINYFNNKQKKGKVISFESSTEEIANFLLNELKISKETIAELELDGETLFYLEKSDIDGLNIPNSEKEILKEFIEDKEKNYKFNIFILICFQENYFNKINISFYYTKENDNDKKNANIKF